MWMERTRANPSVETVIGTGTASEGSANRTVMILGRPVVRPVGMNLKTPSVRVSRGTCGIVRGGTVARGNRERLPMSVFVGCQQGFNKRLMAKTGNSSAVL